MPVSQAAVSSLLTVVLETQLPVCDDLLAYTFSSSLPSHPHLYSSAGISRAIPFRFADCVCVRGTLVVYPRVISSTDGAFALLATLAGTNSAETAVYRAIHSLVSRARLGDCWRALISVDGDLRVTVRVSDMFRREEFSSPVSLVPSGTPQGLHLDRGRLFVDGIPFAVSGNFIYSFVNRVLEVETDLHVYCEGGVLLSIRLDRSKQLATIQVVDTLGYSAISLFMFDQLRVGVVMSGCDVSFVSLLHSSFGRIAMHMVPLEINGRKFPVSACVSQQGLYVTLCGREGGEVVELHSKFLEDLPIC